MNTWYPPVEKKSVEEIAREVIAGKWGSGADRKQRLTDAGYDPNEVQAMVNAMLGVRPTVQKPAVDLEAVAKEVIRGKWGSGTARRNNLKKAGFTDAQITEIQKLVNQLMK